MKRTPLYNRHVENNGRMVEFAGFELPVQYESIIKEHMAVREKAGMFDVSHMGKIVIEGADAAKNMDYIFSNSFSNMKDGVCKYSLMLYPDGRQVDDVLVYKKRDDNYFVVINAANAKKDINWIEEHLQGDVKLVDYSDSTSIIALQGPKSKDILESISESDLPSKFFSFIEDVNIGEVRAMVSRTGYTGEYGYEIYVKNEDAESVFDMLLEKSVRPCGLGARDTLRFEASMPLYGHELGGDIHISSADLDIFIKMDKKDFIGKDAILNKPDDLPIRVGVKMLTRQIARGNEKVYSDGKEIGYITSGAHCPYLGGSYAMAYLDKNFANEGTKLGVDIRGKMVDAEVVALPFIKK